MKDKFIENLKEVFELEDGEIKFEDQFRDYEEWDSLTHLSLIAMMDDEYEVQIEASDFEQINTVGELFEVLKK